MNPDAAGFGLYVHWPFCLSKCPYCDFNSHVHDSINVEDWKNGYLAALKWFAAQTGRREISSVFFGGGTPSLMPPALVADILDTAGQLWSMAADVEITLEANPTSAEAGKFRDFAAAGVNRLSLGIQALNDADLGALGRQHTAREAIKAWQMAHAIFPRASFDLIYARPGQTRKAWEKELRQALSLGARHISAYQLTMEPETPFHKRYEAGKLHLPDEETAIAMYEQTRAIMAGAGLELYEISNFSVPGAQCRHNLLYWRYGEYAGIGPGAHSRLIAQSGQRRAISAIRAPARWLARAQQGGIEEDVPLSPHEAAREYLLMSLRMTEGLDLTRHAALGGAPVNEDACADLIAQGLLHRPGSSRIAATNAGRLVLDHVITQLA